MERRGFLQLSVIGGAGLAVGLKPKSYPATIQWSYSDYDQKIYAITVDIDGLKHRFGLVGKIGGTDLEEAKELLIEHSAKCLNIPKSSISLTT